MHFNQDDLLNAIQCLWEAVVEKHREDTDAQQHWDSIGTPLLRKALRGPEIVQAYMEGWVLLEELGSQSDMAPFDFQYVPWFVDSCLDWGENVSLKTDWQSQIQSLSTRNNFPSFS